jgi:hypothetical protein
VVALVRAHSDEQTEHLMKHGATKAIMGSMKSPSPCSGVCRPAGATPEAERRETDALLFSDRNKCINTE